MNQQLPIQALIENRRWEFGLTRIDLVRRAGYANTAKGLRRLEALMNDDLDSTKGLIATLPEALDLPPEIIAEAIEETRREMHEREEQAWRAAFRAHGIILTEKRMAEQITFALLTGAPRHLGIE